MGESVTSLRPYTTEHTFKPQKEEVPSNPVERKSNFSLPEKFGTLALKKQTEKMPEDIQQAFGKTVAERVVPLSENTIQTVVFDTGITVLPEAGFVYFPDHVNTRQNFGAAFETLASSWETWESEAEKEDSQAANIKLVKNVIFDESDLPPELRGESLLPSVEDHTLKDFGETTGVVEETGPLPRWVRGLVAARLASGASAGIDNFTTGDGRKISVEWEFPKASKDEIPNLEGYRNTDGKIDFDALERKFGQSKGPKSSHSKYTLVNTETGRDVPFSELSDEDVRFLYAKTFGRNYSSMPKTEGGKILMEKDGTISYATGKEELSYGDLDRPTREAVASLAPVYSPVDVTPLVNYKAQFSGETPDIHDVLPTSEKTLGSVLLEAAEAINAKLPENLKVEPGKLTLNELLIYGNQIRVAPRLVSQDLIIVSVPQTGSVIVAKRIPKSTEKEDKWISRFFVPKQGDIATQIDDWLELD